ncbi:MAG: PilZ domain-containing protein [Spirochaetales bacterium]|nr:PilZ domain-containing protein [Spirochaetales bacterium]
MIAESILYTTGEQQRMGALVNRIEKEFIFSTLIKNGDMLSIHGRKKEARYRLNNVNEETLELLRAEKGGSSFQKDEEVRIFFEFQNNYYTFEGKVLTSEKNDLTVVNPKVICRNPQRKYERVRLKDIHVSFDLEGDKVELDFPRTDTFTLVEKPEFSSTFNPQSIVELINTFRTYIHEKVSDHRVVMYRDKSPQTFEEKITTKYGKTFWIQNTDEDFPIIDLSSSGNIIIKKEIENYMEATGIPKSILKSEVSNLLYSKSKAGIVSEIYAPVLYHEYAVGYVYVVSKKTQGPLDDDFLTYVNTFSKVLSYSLEINGYYKQNVKGMEKHIVPVIDMSGSGLLFASNQEKLISRIHLLNDIDVTIDLNDKKIIAGSRIMRMFKGTQYNYFATQFLKIDEEDFHYLFEYLYGKPFSEKDEMSWEGGAPPPGL